MNIKKLNHMPGFTLIELLVVISILGIIATFVITNVAGARLRAQDAKKKAEINSLKTALQLYYNKYQTYPDSTNGLTFKGCGTNGDTDCLSASGVCTSAAFAAGGVDGCETVFMQRIEKASPTSNYYFFKWYQCDSRGDYRAKATLSNKSDPDISESQLRCPADTCIGQSLNYITATDYVICPN